MAKPDKKPDPERQERQENQSSEAHGTIRGSKEETFGFLSVANIGLEMGGVILVMTLIGWWIDGKLGSSPWCLIAGVAIGLTGSLYKIFKASQRLMKD